MQHWEAETREMLINSKAFNWFDSKASSKLNFLTWLYFERKRDDGVEWRKNEEVPAKEQ